MNKDIINFLSKNCSSEKFSQKDAEDLHEKILRREVRLDPVCNQISNIESALNLLNTKKFKNKTTLKHFNTLSINLEEIQKINKKKLEDLNKEKNGIVIKKINKIKLFTDSLIDKQIYKNHCNTYKSIYIFADGYNNEFCSHKIVFNSNANIDLNNIEKNIQYYHDSLIYNSSFFEGDMINHDDIDNIYFHNDYIFNINPLILIDILSCMEGKGFP